MNTYAKAFLIAGVINPIFLQMIASESMPWWPDTVSMGIASGPPGDGTADPEGATPLLTAKIQSALGRSVMFVKRAGQWARVANAKDVETLLNPRRTRTRTC